MYEKQLYPHAIWNYVAPSEFEYMKFESPNRLSFHRKQRFQFPVVEFLKFPWIALVEGAHKMDELGNLYILQIALLNFAKVELPK